MKVLIIEDDRELALSIKKELQDRYIVETAPTGKKGENLIENNSYDLLIIDLKLPDKNGIEICQKLRKYGITTPILILTGSDNIENKVLALDSGADDYLVKPFRLPELKARIRALMRRGQPIYSDKILKVGDLTLDIGKRMVKRNQQTLSLRRKELDLLEYLMQNAGRILTREMILDKIWDSSRDALYNTVDVHIKYLRDKIDRKFKKKLIKTVYGLGYKIDA